MFRSRIDLIGLGPVLPSEAALIVARFFHFGLSKSWVEAEKTIYVDEVRVQDKEKAEASLG